MSSSSDPTSDPTPAPAAQQGPHAPVTAPAPPPQFKVYRPPQRAAPQEDLPEDYFTPTLADLRAHQEQLHTRASTLSNAPLLTRAAREQQAAAKRERWPNTTLRVRFPDRTQLERAFPSSSKIRAVYAFVRDALREDAKPTKFVLSSSPPLRELKVSDAAVRELTLAELGLAPSSVLLLRFVDDALNRPDQPAPLAAAVLEHAVDLPVPPEFDGAPGRGAASSSAPASGRGNTLGGAASTGSGDVKIPKWLKLGPKK